MTLLANHTEKSGANITAKKSDLDIKIVDKREDSLML